jgi:hypothetical protein
MHAHPEPPSDLAHRELPLLTTAQLWFRIHSTNLAALFFGRKAVWRFDAPGREYGVLYAAEDAHCAFVETFGHATGGVPLVSEDLLRRKSLATIEPARALRLVDLTAQGLARLGADNRLCTGDYRLSQRWSKALHGHPKAPDGICYRSRHDPSKLCAAIFERAGKLLRVTADLDLDDRNNRASLRPILDHYGFGITRTTGIVARRRLRRRAKRQP